MSYGRLFLLISLVSSHALAADKRGLTAAPETAGTRRALIIGNQKYAVGALENSRKDAQDVSEQLKALGFQVTLALDVGNKDLARTVDVYADSLRASDVSFFYYSGHGVAVGGENYLVPVDFAASKEADVPYEAYALERLTQRLADRSPALSVIVLDACRNNPFLKTRGGSRGLTGVDAARGTFIAFATAPGQTASDGTPGGNGVYTHALLSRLQEPNIEVETTFKKVREDVLAATNGQQLPWSSTSVVGTFCLSGTRCGSGTSAASSIPALRPTPVAATDQPKLLIVGREEYTDAGGKTSEPGLGALRLQLEKALLAQGFKVADAGAAEKLRTTQPAQFAALLADAGAGARLAREVGADYLVRLQGSVRHTSFNDLGLNEHHGFASVALEAVEASTGELVVSLNAEGTSPPNCYSEAELPSKAVAHVGLPKLDELGQRIHSSWDKLKTEGVRYTVLLAGLKGAQAPSMRRLVEQLPGVRQVRQVSFERGNLTLEVGAAVGGDASGLQEALLEAAGKQAEFRKLEMTAVHDRSLAFELR